MSTLTCYVLFLMDQLTLVSSYHTQHVKGELDDCGRFTVEDKGCLGPFCGKLKGTAGSNAVESGGEVSGDDFRSRIGDLVREAVKSVGVELEGKLAARGCANHKW